MQSFLFKFTSKLIAVIVAVVLVFGVLHFAFEKQQNGNVTNCPFDVSHATLCKMTLTDHMRNWQNTFLVIPVNGILGLIAAVLALLALGSSANQFRFIYRKLPVYSYIRSSRNERTTPAEHFLKHALARGILNPKTF